MVPSFVAWCLASATSRPRRVVAAQYITWGMCVFRVLSQPTSGLSSKDAIDLVLYLQTIAHVTQATVLLTIHQPPASAYAALDDVLILKQGNVVCVYLRDWSPSILPMCCICCVCVCGCLCVWLCVCLTFAWQVSWRGPPCSHVLPGHGIAVGCERQYC